MVMKTLEIQLPEPIVADLDKFVRQGWFANQNEIVRLALLEFVRRNRLALIEQFQREDIAWALRQKGNTP